MHEHNIRGYVHAVMQVTEITGRSYIHCSWKLSHNHTDIILDWHAMIS